MNSYNNFEIIINTLLYEIKDEFEPVCKIYETIYSINSYYYKRHRFFDDQDQEINYNLLTDMVEYVCETTKTDIKIIDDKIIPIHYYSTGNPPYTYLDIRFSGPFYIFRDELESRRILRAIYWLLFTKRYKLSNEDKKYVLRKYWCQRIYEYENKKNIIPKYIYQFYNTILFFDKMSSKNIK